MPRIFINPGHGCSYEYNSDSKYPYGLYAEGNDIQNIQIPDQWDDPGACSNGLQEAERCLVIGKLVAKYLTAVGYDCILFQYDGLGTICNKENASGADVFISIHCNAAESIQAQGTETYHYYNAVAGKKLATTIYNQIVNNIDIIDRGVREANFAVIKNTHAPACLVETAFITNAYDANLLRNNYDDIAKCIARGISDYFVK